MTQREVFEIIDSISEINWNEAEFKDQILLSMSVTQFAEQVKPLIVKYADKLPEASTFLFKL